jgi:hypothetical protein
VGTIENLKQELCWVVFRFGDGSLKYLQTTLNQQLLAGIGVRQDALFDFELREWVELRRLTGARLEIYDVKPELREVDIFASKFIK